MFEAAKEAILNSSQSSSIYIGCDSIRYSVKGCWFARYTTVVVLHMDSAHGAKIFYETITLPDYAKSPDSVKMRMLTEAQLACDAATEILLIRGKRHLEVHLDINGNPKHKSNVAVKEALSYVRGMTGLVAKIKPEAFAASYAADHCVRGKLH